MGILVALMFAGFVFTERWLEGILICGPLGLFFFWLSRSKPQLDCYGDYFYYRNVVKRKIAYDDVSGIALNMTRYQSGKVETVYVKLKNGKTKWIATPWVYENGNELVPTLKKMTGIESAGLLSSEEFRCWKKS